MTEPTRKRIEEMVLAICGVASPDISPDDLADALNDARTAILEEAHANDR